MAKLVTVEVTRPAVNADSLVFMRYGKLKGGYIATSEAGNWHHFTPDEFEQYLGGKTEDNSIFQNELVQKGLMREGFDLEFHARKFRQLKRFLAAGVSHHHVALQGETGTLETDVAKAIVDQIITCASDELNVIFMDDGSGYKTGILEFFQEYAKEKNQYEGKTLNFALSSPLTTLTDSDAAWLIANGFQLQTHFDGVEEIHNGQTEETGASPFEATLAGIQTYLQAGKNAKMERHQISLLVTTALHKDMNHAALLAAYREQGIREFKVLPLQGEMEVETYVSLYRGLLDELMKAETGTPRVRELGISNLLARVHQGEDVDSRELQSPASAGLSELSYDVEGNIFPSNAARELFEEGDPMFHLGKAGEVNPKEVRKSDTVRALTIASIVDCLPGYKSLWTSPFLAVDPIQSYIENGDLFPSMPLDSASRARHEIISTLFDLLLEQPDDQDAVYKQLAGAGEDGI